MHNLEKVFVEKFLLMQGALAIALRSTYIALQARIRPVMQLALHDHQIADRKILSRSDSIRTYAMLYATRESVYQIQMPLMAVFETALCVAKRTGHVVRLQNHFQI